MADKTKIKEVLIDQLGDIPGLLDKCRVERIVEPELHGALKDTLVKVISGVRRCGKSVLAHRVLKDLPYGYADFDDERLADLSTADLNLVLEVLLELKPGLKYILLDEIQNIEKWELFVARLQRGGYKVILTGSNARLLSRDLSTHLTGRHKVFEIYPFSFLEYLRSRGIDSPRGKALGTRSRACISAAFSDYFSAGGFPELPGIVDKKSYLHDLYDKILTQDIALRHGVRHIKTLKDIALYTANNYASKLSYQNIKEAYSLGSIHTVKNYLAYMQEAYLFFAVEAFSRKARERVRLPRKMYGIDAALLRSISVSGQKNEGRLLENLVYLELLRRKKQVLYYSDPQRKYEVDFVCRQSAGEAVELIQVCLDTEMAEVKERELRGLQSALTAFKNISEGALTLITLDRGGAERIAGRQVKCVPAWEWLLNP
ncbi:MAG: ATP-binding protein [Elusimicrobia bacterium]|nr:ATP-binding protein [Elusimicrobiota bacterium]